MRVSVYELAYSTTSLLKAVAKLARAAEANERAAPEESRREATPGGRRPAEREEAKNTHMAAQTSASEDEEDDASAAPGAAPGAPPGYACQHCRALCPYNARRCGACGRGVRYAPAAGPEAEDGDDDARRASAPPSARRAAPGRAGPRLSPVGAFDAREVAAHLSALRCEQLHRALRQLVQRLMQHPLNQNWFNEPVDPVRLNLPDYFAIVREPMDLGTVKSRLAAFAYSDVPALAADVRRVFDNAQRYNPPRNAVHRAAAELARDFDADLERALERCARASQAAHEHACGLCRGRRCALCGDKCITLEAPALICSGPCQQRVRRDQQYHATRDGSRLWCHKCYLGLKAVIPPPADAHARPRAQDAAHAQATGLWYKRDLIKRRFDCDVHEPWVQCDCCLRWAHQACALFNAKAERDARGAAGAFVCPLCELQHAHLPPRGKRRRGDGAEAAAPLRLRALTKTRLALEDDDDAASDDDGGGGGGAPARAARAGNGRAALRRHGAAVVPARGPLLELREGDAWHGPPPPGPPEAAPGAVAGARRRAPGAPARWWRAADLADTRMTAFLQARVRQRMVELGGAAAGFAPTVAVKLVSCVPRRLRAPDILREHFRGRDGAALPEFLKYESRAVVLFQKLDGCDVMVFSMYVHEFPTAAGGPSAGRVYVAYLDSVEYFRPRTARTEVYHELLVAYLDWSRGRGFDAAHIWACPPQRGNNFIFWCHPQHQRTPSRERLTEWYRAMVARATATGAVRRVATLYDECFAAWDTTRRRHKPQHAQRPAVWVDNADADEGAPAPRLPVCPPVFDGDYWPEECGRLGGLIERRRGLFGGNHALRSQTEGAPEHQLEGLVLSLKAQPAAYPFNRPVDPEALGLKDYRTVCPHPMDLGTVATQLQAKRYATPDRVVADVRLVFRNASRYNPPGHPVHEAARTLLAHFERKLDQLLERLVSTGAAESPDAWLAGYPLDRAAADAEDRAPSVRARLLPELAGSVHRMKESLFVLYLQDGRADASGEIRDPDAGLRLSCPLLDSRHTFLEMCQFWHYQFDSLRRAKHSTVMLLYHLHVPRAESLGISCAACAREIRRVRWHCATCVDFNICRACERERGAAHRHALTPFRITFSRRRALAPEPARIDRAAVAVDAEEEEDDDEEDEDDEDDEEDDEAEEEA